MPPAMPPGDPAPVDGLLPPAPAAAAEGRTLGIYIHVPFCRVRCGYCDFNTYTAKELGAGADTIAGYLDAALAEMDLANRVLREHAGQRLQLPAQRCQLATPDAPGRLPRPSYPPVETIFIGGGTPTLLPVDHLGALIEGVQRRWEIAPGAEVTTEANPDTLSHSVAAGLAQAGFTRVSIGMQSAVPHVLATLDRTHLASHLPAAVDAVQAAGMQVSLDLIYGSPGESLADWRRSVQAALELEPDHISAYALTIEEGTAMGAAVRRGTLPMPTDDDEADKYEVADELLTEAGFEWYEISNWARDPGDRCRHNLAYWRGQDWWGIGPGAHSHVEGTRWWNVKHPSAYGARLRSGRSPALAREVLTQEQRYDERVLLGLRLREGLAIAALNGDRDQAVNHLVDRGLLDSASAQGGYAVLTRPGRLLADTAVHALLGETPINPDVRSVRTAP